MNQYLMALDQGTTSSRAIIFDRAGRIVSLAQYPFRQYYPQPGWVEHDPQEILDTQLKAAAEAFEKSALSPTDIAAIGITNQRETTVIWEKRTGKPVGRAIVWQCRRTAPLCEQLRSDGLEPQIRQTTGLVIDSYFSATKIRWILEQDAALAARAARGELLFGTVDSWLLWNLTGGAVHATDVSNASRTMLFDIARLRWDETLCSALGVPMAMLPQVVGSSEVYGTLAAGLPGLQYLAGTPIAGMAGDQQAALFGQCCFVPGMAKNTYGTGCFTLMNVGETDRRSKHGLLTSVAWQLHGKVTYALEGSAFQAGSAIQWLRDECKMLSAASEADRLAESVSSTQGVYFVPAFTGLGAPYWDSYARGSFFGLTRGSGRAEMVRAVLESIAFEVTDLVQTMNRDAGCPVSELRVDGGASVSDVMLQFQADLLHCAVNRPQVVETTAWGAASLAGLAVGVWSDLAQMESVRQVERVFTPAMPDEARSQAMHAWHTAVELSRQWGRQIVAPNRQEVTL